MNQRKTLLTAFMCCFILLGLGGGLAAAQGPEEIAEDPIIVAPAGRLDLTFAQLGRGTRQLRGHNALETYTVNIPGNFRIIPDDSFLELTMSHFPSIPDKASNLEITMEDDLLFTVPITEGTGGLATRQFPLPENALTVGFNQLRLRLDTSGSCEEDGALVNLTVDESSRFSFAYEQLPYLTDLSLYPLPFVEDSLLEIATTLVLPDLPTSNDLSAAATIVAGLGQESNGRFTFNAVTFSELTPEIRENNHLIVIGSPDTNPLLAELDLPLAIDDTIIQPGYGVLEEIVSPWNAYRVVLVVSGLDDEGVGKASIGLNRTANFLGLRGPVGIVVELGNLPPPLDVVNEESITLEGRGYDNQVVYGTAAQTFDYDFYLPLRWQLDAPPFFQLYFAHADTLDPERSSIDVSLNGLPLGSSLLTPANRDDGELIMPIPASQLRSGRNRISVLVDTHLLGGAECDGETDRRVWTLISNQSEIFLPYASENIAPSLRNFPFPFGQAIGIENTYFVLPDLPNSSHINQMLRLAFRMGGTSLTQKLTTPVIYASEVDDAIRENNHLIVLGRPTDNEVIAEVNNELPHPFIPNTNVLSPLTIDQIVFLADPERDAGFLQILDSPWNPDYTLLVVTGTTDEGVEYGATALANARRGLDGDLAVVEPTLRLPNAPVATTEEIETTIYAVDTRTISSDPNAGIELLADGEQLSSSQEVGLSERWWK